MHLSDRRPPLGLAILLLLAISAVQAQSAPAIGTSVPAPPVDVPAAGQRAPASTASSANTDQVDLQQIRNFSRVYELVRQAYVEKVDNKTLMKDAITGMLAGLDPHSEYLDKEGLQQLSEDTSGQYSGL
ncbi:MAG TPA: peptidase S41, partial [Rhodanobacter sp.]|nr:peptidase S41 [Rhodanobacter sp.]